MLRDAVAAKGRDAVLDTEVDKAHIAQAFQTRYGVDVSAVLRSGVTVMRERRAQILDGFLAGETLSARLERGAAVIERASSRLATVSTPSGPVRVIPAQGSDICQILMAEIAIVWVDMDWFCTWGWLIGVGEGCPLLMATLAFLWAYYWEMGC